MYWIDVCVSNKTKDLNLSVFNMITGVNESKKLTKYISCKCKCKFDENKCNSGQWWNKDKCRCEGKKHHLCEKDYVWNPAPGSCENGKYFASIMGDSTIMYNEIIDVYDETQFNEKKANCKTQNVYILLTILLITTALLIAISIYCYLIKYQAKQKHLLQFHDTNNELIQKYLLPFHNTN